MPELLISVRNAAEAQTALQGGCSVLDIKNPAAGALGQPEQAELAEVLATSRDLNSLVPISCALGELGQVPAEIRVPAGCNQLSYLKIGPAGLARADLWKRRFASVQQQFRQAGVTRPRWIAAFYLDFDRAETFDAIHELEHTHLLEDIGRELGCAGILFDTFDKAGSSAGTLLAGPQRRRTLRNLLLRCRDLNLLTALAGRLTLEEMQELRTAQVNPDLFAFRSALCEQADRQATLDFERVKRAGNLLKAAAVVGSQACDV